MNADPLNYDAILAKYPEQKPVCLNYVDTRKDIIALTEEILRLQKRLACFEEGLNPDVAAEFAVRADEMLEKIDALLKS